MKWSFIWSDPSEEGCLTVYGLTDWSGSHSILCVKLWLWLWHKHVEQNVLLGTIINIEFLFLFFAFLFCACWQVFVPKHQEEHFLMLRVKNVKLMCFFPPLSHGGTLLLVFLQVTYTSSLLTRSLENLTVLHWRRVSGPMLCGVMHWLYSGNQILHPGLFELNFSFHSVKLSFSSFVLPSCINKST